MPHSIGGLDLTFTSRTSWKAEIKCHGKVVAIAPVTWTKGRCTKEGTQDVFLRVWFRNAEEIETHRTRAAPFIVAVAMAKDYNQHPHQFQDFRTVFEVVATGEIFDERISKPESFADSRTQIFEASTISPTELPKAKAQ